MRKRVRETSPKDAPKEDPESALTRHEAEVYDRQLRLWGHGAQWRLSQSCALMVVLSRGTSDLLWFELAKNLVLAGIGHLTVSAWLSNPGKYEGTTESDSSAVCGEGLAPISETQAFRDIKEMNPFVTVEPGPDAGSLLKSVENLVNLNANCVCIVSPDFEEPNPPSSNTSDDMTPCTRLAEFCAELNIPCFIAASIGYCCGFFVSELEENEHSCIQVAEASNKRTSPGGIRFHRAEQHAKPAAVQDPSQNHPRWKSTYGNILAKLRDVSQDDASLNIANEDAWRPFLRWMTFRRMRMPHPLYKVIGATARSALFAENDDSIPTSGNVVDALGWNFPPLAKVIGGIWSLEVIKMLAGIDHTQYFGNFFFFDGMTACGAFTKLVTSDISIEPSRADP